MFSITKNPVIYLVNMPYAAIERPSISLGILKSELEQSGFTSIIRYANLDFAERIGLESYYWISNSGDYTDLFGEWTFAKILFPDAHFDDEKYFQEHLENTYTEATFRLLLPGRDIRLTLEGIRKKSEELIEDLAEEIIRNNPLIVGCSSSYHQNCASLALLRQVHEKDDKIITIMGGANCEGVMGLALKRNFPWVDFVFSGEADLLLPTLIGNIQKSGRDIKMPLPVGVIGASNEDNFYTESVPRTLLLDINQSAVPNYDDYFEQLRTFSYKEHIASGLPIEISRGCWWGAKNRCTFCGLNGEGLRYRVKSKNRVFDEFSSLSKRYGLNKFEVVDNVLAIKDQKDLFNKLRDFNYSIFYETRVLDYEYLKILNEGGLNWIQVGIESFHDKILKLMNKGTRTIQNIMMLRNSYELGIRVTYNLLYSFPGEQDDWYLEMSRLFPLIAHLEPPRNMVPLRFDRFSVYHQYPERFGLKLRPKDVYHYIYDLPDDQIENIAYFFENQKLEDLDQAHTGLDLAKKEWLSWRYSFWTCEPGRERAMLYQFDHGSKKVLIDTRPCSSTIVTFLNKIESELLEYCRKPRNLKRLLYSKDDIGFHNISTKSLLKGIYSLIDKSILLCIGDEVLSLPTRLPKHRLLTTMDFPGGFYLPTQDESQHKKRSA